MVRFKVRKGVTVMKVVKRLMYTLIGLFAGGLIMTVFGEFMNGSCSQFYTGFELIGWTVGAPNTMAHPATSPTSHGCAITDVNTIISTTPSGTTLLGIAGLIALISVVTSIFSMRMQ